MKSAASTIIAAFSEDQAARLTGVSKGQLRYWDKSGFYQPSYAESNRRLPYSRVYSFKDVVALRVLGALKNQYGVSLQHLRDVSDHLSQFGPDPDKWVAANLYVLNRKVVWHEPGTDLPQQIVNKQYVLETIELKKIVEKVKRDVSDIKRARDSSQFGKIAKNRFIAHNKPVIAGTRIPISAIQNFADAGYTPAQIVEQYPDLTMDDVKAALEHKKKQSAA